MTPSTSTIIAVVQDLLFGTKIRSTARTLGVDVRVVRTADELRRELELARISLVIVDLGLAGTEAWAAIESTVQHATRPRILAFVAHVLGHLVQKATEAGADEVMPRSRFSQQLPAILQTYGPPNRVPLVEQQATDPPGISTG